MSKEELWDAPHIVPSITYTDLPRAIEWLQRVFGFRERSEARLSWPGGGMTWLEVGNGLINVSTPDETWPQNPNAATKGFVMKVYVDDVDSHFAHVKAEGAIVVSEPQDGFWGGRIYRVLDLEGRQWEFSQQGRDWAAHKWQLPPGVFRGVPK
ncbi:MAG: VOC family protein [Blastocatellia bacterium]